MADSELVAELDLARVAVLCAEVPRVERLEEGYAGVPSDGSNAARDVADLEGDDVEKASWVTLLSRLWLAAAQDCLLGLAVLFNSPIRNHAPRSLLRSVLEHSGRAHWVVAASDADGRAARAWLARYVGVCEELRISQKDEGGTGAMAQAPGREDHIRKRIVELFGEKPDTTSGTYRLWTLLDEVQLVHADSEEPSQSCNAGSRGGGHVPDSLPPRTPHYVRSVGIRITRGGGPSSDPTVRAEFLDWSHAHDPRCPSASPCGRSRPPRMDTLQAGGVD